MFFQKRMAKHTKKSENYLKNPMCNRRLTNRWWIFAEFIAIMKLEKKKKC
jgi:hypothetical protein